MTTCYLLFNTTKAEYIAFTRLPVCTSHEIINHPIATAMIAYYLLHNSGDTIIVLSEYDEDRFPDPFDQYREVSDATLDHMIEHGFAFETKREYLLANDPTIYTRHLELQEITWAYRE